MRNLSNDEIQRAKECAQYCIENGFSCGGCDKQHVCGILDANAQWLSSFMGEIDPAGNITTVYVGPLGSNPDTPLDVA